MKVDTWRLIDWSSGIGEQRADQPFGAIMPLASPGLGPPVGPRLACFWQRLSLGGSGFVKADSWRCRDRSRKIGKQISGQPFGASALLAPPGLGPPGGLRLGGLPAAALAWGLGIR